MDLPNKFRIPTFLLKRTEYKNFRHGDKQIPCERDYINLFPKPITLQLIELFEQTKKYGNQNKIMYTCIIFNPQSDSLITWYITQHMTHAISNPWHKHSTSNNAKKIPRNFTLFTPNY